MFPAFTDAVKTSFKFEIANIFISAAFIVAMIVDITAILKPFVG
jgi:hypothetical protein